MSKIKQYVPCEGHGDGPEMDSAEGYAGFKDGTLDTYVSYVDCVAMLKQAALEGAIAALDWQAEMDGSEGRHSMKLVEKDAKTSIELLKLSMLEEA